MKNEIRTYLTTQPAFADAGKVSDTDSLLEAGVIDSLRMLDIITHLEKMYGIQVDDMDMTPENFDSIEAIAAYVTRKQADQ